MFSPKVLLMLLLFINFTDIKCINFVKNKDCDFHGAILVVSVICVCPGVIIDITKKYVSLLLKITFSRLKINFFTFLLNILQSFNQLYFAYSGWE